MKNLLILLLCIPYFNSHAQYFDTGLEYRHKVQVGKGVTLSGLALMNYTEGPIEAIGAVWVVGGTMNFISAKQEANYYEYEPTKTQWRKEIAPITAMFLAGAVNGVNQDLFFHYNEFESTFPNANPHFWDPNISWRNKYLNGDPLQGERFLGSSTIFAGFTDGYHSTILARNLFITTSICLSPQTRGWKPFLTKTLVYSLSYGLGFELVYSKLIK
tara:strand:- start:241 stop:885 length:645 start_codon:yes stop_codon:yes gene_type:complete